MKKLFILSGICLICLFSLPRAYSHCQIPCGIYNDGMRFAMMEEYVLTIEKSMKQIIELSRQPEKDYNQVVRWVMNKEQHADELAHVVTYYFLTQRIKPVDEKDSAAFKDYLQKIRLLHQMLVYAMRVKQTTDLAHVEMMRSLLKDFHTVYFGKEEAGHDH